MKNYWLLLFLSVCLGTTFAWAMNYADHGHREAYFGEITMDGSVNADNIMEVLSQYYSTSSAKVGLEGEPTFDFGTMGPGSKGKHEFVIKNIGEEELELSIGASTCKCTLGSLGDENLAPGASTSVTMEWTVSTDKDIFNQSAELRTNDPARPAIRLTVTGRVIRDIEFEPKQVTFGEVAAGESFEVTTRMYSYLEGQIDVKSASFGSEQMNELSEFVIEPLEIDPDSDNLHKRARQAFEIKAKVRGGLRQGPMVTTLQIGFNKINSSGETIVRDGTPSAKLEQGLYATSTEIAGRVIGSLSMFENSMLKSISGGGYVWTVGKLGPEADLEVKGFVVLKGSERDNTNLTIGEVTPDYAIRAELGESLGRGSMRLYPITLRFTPGEELIDLLGKNKEDFGKIWIESDNPKVSRMQIAVKVAIEPRP